MKNRTFSLLSSDCLHHKHPQHTAAQHRNGCPPERQTAHRSVCLSVRVCVHPCICPSVSSVRPAVALSCFPSSHLSEWAVTVRQTDRQTDLSAWVVTVRGMERSKMLLYREALWTLGFHFRRDLCPYGNSASASKPCATAVRSCSMRARRTRLCLKVRQGAHGSALLKCGSCQRPTNRHQNSCFA
jgi:hypothetical protein